MATTTKTKGRKHRTKKPKVKLKKFIDQRLARALSHPVRAHVLYALNDRVASSSDLAEEIGMDVDYVAYHVRTLRRNECIEPVKTEQRRGATERYYQATAKLLFDDQEWERLPASIKPSLSGDLLKVIIDDAAQALKTGSFDERDDRHLTRMPLSVDERGWDDLNTALRETFERVSAIQAESAERMAATGEEAISVTVAMMGFESSSDSRRKTEPASTA